jgi:hypothetical protein
MASRSLNRDWVLLGGLAVGGFVLYKLLTQLVPAAGQAAAGLVTGNNPITAGTPYQGAGIVATPAAIANAASGGLLARIGSWLGTSTYAALHPYAGITVGASSIMLGDGTEIPVGAVTVSDSDGTFAYHGTTYKVQGPADETGTVYAVAQ